MVGGGKSGIRPDTGRLKNGFSDGLMQLQHNIVHCNNVTLTIL
ncbi:hypothetical protein HMPREF9123_2714 [Neisseria bacilliformis ATCC BAA-1200]|uniref:Uncharacterized protein n=1 Tax=Neisseria bacilliformis ATCC BAA-1200 TaxID=888742 RepID=F2BG57_9NEIS|nr:hypothetical protein HMPREF9123_2714 [Neisseria bacilliformis ATCC BAA-1200]